MAIDVTEKSWNPSGLLHLPSSLKERRENNACANVKIYGHRDEYCSINALVIVFKEIFVGFYDIIKGLSIRVEVDQVYEMVLSKKFMGMWELLDREYLYARRLAAEKIMSPYHSPHSIFG